MNWGFKITLLYVGFVAMILTLVFKASGEKVDLVTKDYYAQELKHQGKMEASTRVLPFKDQIKVKVDRSFLTIQLPLTAMPDSGNVGIYRPSDSTQDKSFKLGLDANGAQSMSTEGWQMGYYKINISWTSKGEEYLFEDTFFIP
ncbi:MAG: hypothetical protein RL204_2465 [Bacteroidota bacterium]|jgi:hypothetical protein